MKSKEAKGLIRLEDKPFKPTRITSKPDILINAELESEEQLQKLLHSVDELEKNFHVGFDIQLNKRKPI